MLHYADQFDFQHIPFGEPYGSLDYLAAIRFALGHNKTGKRPTVIIDSASHEHEGPGGMIDLQDQIARRMATVNGAFDAKKYERIKMLAWAEPKGKRRALINGMLNVEANFILCFRAKESSVPMQKVVQKDGGGSFTKTEVVNQGFVPIGGDDFVYECTLAALLMPGARGVPSWKSDLVGEKRMIKLPEQFLSLEALDKPLDEATGEKLAKWAEGVKAARSGETPASQPEPSPETNGKGKAKAAAWVEWFEGEVAKCTSNSAVGELEKECKATLDPLADRFPDLFRRAKEAADERVAELME